MQGENHQDGYSTRVRHVPIQVESRGPSTRGYQERPSDDRVNNQSSRDNHMDSYNRSNSQNNQHNDRTYSPTNTSSINIDYKPPTPQRRPDTSNQTDGNEISNDPFAAFFGPQEDNKHRAPRDREGQQNSRAPRGPSRNRRRHPSNNQSPNSDKLVSSPEPIPLPPPPSDHNQQQQPNDNRSHQDEQQQQQQLKQQKQRQPCGSDISPDNHKERNPCPQMGDGHVSPQQKGSDNQKRQGQQSNEKDTSVLGQMNSVREQVTNLLRQIEKFDGISASSKEYRELDEMLTRCILRLDEIQCGDSIELRQHRKATIQLVDKATDILQRKLQINTDIYNLSARMTVPL